MVAHGGGKRTLMAESWDTATWRWRHSFTKVAVLRRVRSSCSPVNRYR